MSRTKIALIIPATSPSEPLILLVPIFANTDSESENYTLVVANLLSNSLAQAEISLALAVLYRPNGPAFELFETDESDVVQAHDFMIPLPKLDTKGVRVLIR